MKRADHRITCVLRVFLYEIIIQQMNIYKFLVDKKVAWCYYTNKTSMLISIDGRPYE